MSTMPGGSLGSGRPSQSDNDIYTVLALLGFLTLGLKTFLEIRHADALAATRRH